MLCYLSVRKLNCMTFYETIMIEFSPHFLLFENMIKIGWISMFFTDKF